MEHAKETPEPQAKGLLGRARAAVLQAQSTAGELSERIGNRDRVVSFHEVPRQAIRHLRPVRLGESFPRPTFQRVEFTDGSVLHVRVPRELLFEATVHREENSGFWQSW